MSDFKGLKALLDAYYGEGDEEQLELFEEPPPIQSSHMDKCVCESFNLFNFGCKCGFLERDKRRKELTKLIEIDEEKRRREKEKDKKAEKYVSDDVGW